MIVGNEKRELPFLKACPFCGNPEAIVIRYRADGVKLFSDRYAILCRYDPGCGAESGWYKSVDEAAGHWNQRKRKWHE